ncbi:hypothetical protein ACJMK2_022156 [Sinanodonta woodiana]|uniref:Dual oxidase maturation factor 1 n=1 Tax=Sinanodonta woodiana TaxID=1069815 RepID=A0ABD3TK80_SINWO
MAWFKAFRNEFGYAQYGSQRMPVMLDIPLTVVIYICVLISIAFLIAAAGIRGKERWYTLIRLVYSLLTGSIILVSIYGYCWQEAYTDIKAPYIYRSDSYIDGKIGIRIGLYTLNITLSGDFKGEGSKVNYNEELLLDDINGPATELYHALDRGLPQPILMVLEHFDVDEGGLRFGRSCRFAGYFAGILLWTAFAFWITSNILLCSVVWYGAVCFTITGVCMVLAIVVYHYLNPTLGFRLPGSQGEVHLYYGWCLWFTLILGILTTLLGIAMILADYKYPKRIAAFFLLETALEDHHDDYPQRYSVPLIQDNMNNERRTTPIQKRYQKHGVDSSPNQKRNPVFEGSDSDLSTENGSDVSCTSGRRLSGIGNDTSYTNDVEQRDNAFDEKRTESSVNRLNEICVNIESNSNDINTFRPSVSDTYVDITSKDAVPVSVHT